MRTIFSLLLAALLCPLLSVANEQDNRFKALPPGTPVLALSGVEAFGLGGIRGTSEIVKITGQPFDQAMQIVTKARPENPFGVQMTSRTIAPVEKDDRLLAVFWARVLDPLPASGEGRTAFIFELNKDPYTKCADYPVNLGREWEQFYVPFTAKMSHATGSANIIFRAGYDPQTIQIAGVQVINYGAAVEMKALPFTVQSYAGRAVDSPWRTAAAERIDRLRKGDLEVVVTRGGKPAVGVDVKVAMQRHAFAWGSAVDAKRLLEKSADADRYRELILKLFNKVVIENHLKWPVWEKDRETGPAAVAWLREHGLGVRGHTLLWPGWKNLPKSLRSLEGDPPKLRAAVLDHVRDEATAFRGQLVEWDVVNEPYTNKDLQPILGEEILADAFRAAHEADPAAKLYINDYSILSSGGTDFAHQDHYEKTIRALLAAGAPVQGIGMQGHFGEDLTPPERMLAILDRFAALGLPIQITEHDVNVYDETLGADFTRDLLTVAFSHPAVVGVLTWGFWEKAHWIPNAAYYAKDWTLRPAGKAWQDLVMKEWWTDVTVKTDERGVARVRGFQGEHAVTAGSSAKPATIGKQTTRVTIDLN